MTVLLVACTCWITLTPSVAGSPWPVQLENLRKPSLAASKQHRELILPEGAVNLAAGRPVTGDEFPIIGKMSYITDGNIRFAERYYVEMFTGVASYLQIDLGNHATIYGIWLWHYSILDDYDLPYDVVVLISDDEVFTNPRVLHNADHANRFGYGYGQDPHLATSTYGTIIQGAPAESGRYLRVYASGGARRAKLLHYVEIEVWGTPLSVGSGHIPRNETPSTAVAESSDEIAADILDLLKDLEDVKPVIRARAACALGRLETAAFPAVPLLLGLLEDHTAVNVYRPADPRNRKYPEPHPRHLEHTSPAETAIVALGRIADRRAIDPLAEVLRGPHKDLQPLAATALGEIDDPRSAEHLLAAMHRAEDDLIVVIAKGLSRLGDQRSVTPFINLLKSDNSELRMVAVEGLSRTKAPEAFEALVAVMDSIEADQVDHDLIRSVIGSLHTLGDTRAVPALIHALNVGSWGIRRAAADALGDMGDPRAVDALQAAINNRPLDVDTAAFIFIALMRLHGSDAHDSLSELFFDLPSVYQRHVIHRLGEMGGDSATKLLLLVMDNAQGETAELALQSLVRIGGERVSDALVAALNSEDEGVRHSAARALVTNKDKRVLEPMIALLQDGNPRVRLAAVRALGNLGDTRAVESLIALLESILTDSLDGESHNLLRFTIESLHSLGDIRAVPALINALDTPDERIRSAAAAALGNLGDPRAVDALQAVIRKFNGDVTSAEAIALLGLQGADELDSFSEQLLSLSIGNQHTFFHRLEKMGGETAVDLSAALMRETSGETARRVVRAIRALGGCRVVDELIAALQSEDENVRFAAALALGDTEDKRAFEPLVALLQDRFFKVRISTVIALGNLGDERAVDVLLHFAEKKEINHKIMRHAIAEASRQIQEAN